MTSHGIDATKPSQKEEALDLELLSSRMRALGKRASTMQRCQEWVNALPDQLLDKEETKTGEGSNSLRDLETKKFGEAMDVSTLEPLTKTMASNNKRCPKETNV